MNLLLLMISVPFVLGAPAIADPDVTPEIATPLVAAKSASPPPAESKPQPKMTAAEIRKISETDFKQCLKDWDSATHMTTQEWQRTCRRLADNRAKFMVEQKDQ